VYGFVLRLYAPQFLARHRAEMLQNFEDLENASSSKAALWLLIGEDLMLSLISRNIPKSFWGRTAPMFIVLAAVLAMWRAFAYDTAPVGAPEALGFSSSRLARIGAWQQAQVDAGAFSGAVAAIARNGRVAYLRAVGFRDRAKTIPLQGDAIFWIASMTKPVTSVAAMILVEEGKLDLAAPVHRYLPELKDLMVGVETTDPASGETKLALEPQKRPMTVEDLLRHTSASSTKTAIRPCTSSTAKAGCTTRAWHATARWRTSCPAWRGSRSPISRARSGNMVTAPTSWDG
jgi:Beta-lactamase